jgi:hypothetical protein
MLKQSTLFNKIKKKNLKLHDYYILYKLYSKPLLNDGEKKIISSNKNIQAYINEDFTLNDQGERFIKSIDGLFKPIKKLTALDLLGEDYQNNIDAYINLFPTSKLPSGKYARGNKKNIQENFMWFFQEYDYEWDVILKATAIYIEEYFKKNYEFMRTAMYFIKKLKDGTAESELANYCDIVVNDTYTPERTFKKKVV